MVEFLKIAEGLSVKRFSDKYADLYLRKLHRENAQLSSCRSLSYEDIFDIEIIQHRIDEFLSDRDKAVRGLKDRLLVLSSNGLIEEIVGEITFSIIFGVKVFTIEKLPLDSGALILDLLCDKYKNSGVRCFYGNSSYSILEKLVNQYGYKSFDFNSSVFKESFHLSEDQVYHILNSEERIITKYNTGAMVKNLESRLLVKPMGEMSDIVKELVIKEFSADELKAFMESKCAKKFVEYPDYTGISYNPGQYCPVYVGFTAFTFYDSRRARSKIVEKYICAIYRGNVIGVMCLSTFSHQSVQYQYISMFDVYDLFLDADLTVLRYMMSNLYKFVYPDFKLCLGRIESKFERAIEFNANVKKFAVNLKFVDNPRNY